MKLTPKQQTILARMSDGEWRRGYSIEAAPNSLAGLQNLELIKGASNGRFGVRDELWQITEAGLAALETNQ